MMKRNANVVLAGLAVAVVLVLPSTGGAAMSATPVTVVAAVRAAAVLEGLPIVSLERSPTLRVVVRLDRPVAQLREGSLTPLLRAVTRVPGARWDVVAVDRGGKRIRESRGLAHGGSAFIRPDLDGCDPSFAVLGRPARPMFASDPICAGDPAAAAAHPVDVGGASVGTAFPLTVATRGQRLYALVNDVLFESDPLVVLPAPIGRATLESPEDLVFAVSATIVVLHRQ